MRRRRDQREGGCGGPAALADCDGGAPGCCGLWSEGKLVTDVDFRGFWTTAIIRKSMSASVADLTEKPRVQEKTWPYFLLFFVSGFPALLYQTVWQRALFTIYRVHV